MNEELKVIISAEIDELKQNVKQAQDEVSKFSKKSKASSKEIDAAFKSIGDSTKNAFKNMAVGVAAAATALTALGASTQEYRVAQSKLTTAFESAGSSAEAAKDTYNDLYRVLGDGDVAVEAANHLAKLTQGEKELNEWTKICQGVYATFGDSIPIEGLTEAANETAKVGTLTGSLADALNWAGVNEEKFQEQLDKCNTEAEREALIRKTLSGIYDEAATKYEESAADVLKQNEAQAKLQETTAKLGAAMAPLVTAFTNLANDALAVVVPYIQQFAETYGPALEEVLKTVGESIGVVFGFISENFEILAAIGGVIMGIVTAIGLYNTVAAIKAAMDAAQVTTLGALIAAHWAQATAAMAALAPYLLIVAAIAAVIAIIVLCVQHWDTIVAAFKTGMENVKNWVSEGMEKVKNAISTAIENVKNFFSGIIDWVKENWQGLLLLLVNPFAGAFKLIYDNCEGFRKVVDDACKAIKEFFANLWQNIKDIFAGVGNFFKDAFNNAVTNVKNVFSGITNFFSGIWNGIKQIFSNVGATIGNAITNTVKTAINGVLSTAIKIINGFISAINLAISVINAIPGVSISKISKLSVPKLAKGGIVDGATLAMIGEQGREAVVPLENNMEWLDKLAVKLSEKTGGKTPIVLQVDGKTFAQTSIDTINQLTRQTGSLALNLV